MIIFKSIGKISINTSYLFYCFKYSHIPNIVMDFIDFFNYCPIDEH